MYERAEATPWELTPENIRAQHRYRAMTLPDPKVLGLIAAAVVLIVFGFIFLGPPAHRTSSTTGSTTTTAPGKSIAVPNVVGLSQASAAQSLGETGLAVGTITVDSSTTYPAGIVMASNPPAGASSTSGAAVDLTVSGGPSGSAGSTGRTVPSTTTGTQPVPGGQTEPNSAATQANCPVGNRSITVAAATAATCVRTGAKLTVTFDSLDWWSGYGSWSTAAPMITGSVLEALSWMPSGKSATAVFDAYAPGSSVVTAQFSVGCAPTDTTPCTVPPQAFETLTVTVATA